MPMFHVTYTKANRTEVGRVHAGSRSQALSEAAIRFGVRRSSVKSAVKLPPRREPPRLPWDNSFD